MHLEVGTIVAHRYEIQRKLGQGGFGHTFLAHDRELERDVALKVLDARNVTDWKAFDMFERETRVLRELRHHGIPQVHDACRERLDGSDAAILVMEYVEGASLATMIDEHRLLDPADVKHTLLELLGILEYLHTRVPAILHRDIKPTNIIVRPNGYPTLVDFGAVRSAFLAPGESGSTIVGTYGYMPYEQYMGQASPASDLYAVGATFLHVLSGRPPSAFMGSEGRIEVPEGLTADARLRDVVARLLRPSPAERFTSARDVRHALLSTLPATPALAVQPATPSVPAVTGERPRALPRMPTIPELPPAPRELTGPVEEAFKRAVPTAWAYMDSSNKAPDRWGVTDVLLFGFFSIVTAGILPAVFFSVASARKRRLRHFFKNGTLAVAEIVGIEVETQPFGEKLARVSYEFEADGVLRRDADRILPVVSNRWRIGDRIPILFITDDDYDSVIIGRA